VGPGARAPGWIVSLGPWVKNGPKHKNKTAPNVEFGSVQGFRLVSWYLVRVAATPLYAACSVRLYPGAQVVRVEHRDAPAAFTL